MMNGRRRAQPWLGTLIIIEAEHDSAECADTAIEAAFDRIAEVHAKMNFHDEMSALARVNREAHTKAVRVPAPLAEVLRLGLELSSVSHGLFDFTAQRSTFGSWRDVTLSGSGDATTVRFSAPVVVDLGGIAKGYAVDAAVEALRDAGVNAACVNAGGDLRWFGPALRKIGIRDPKSAHVLRELTLPAAGALATSSDAHARHRLADLAGAYCRDYGRSVSVFAARCVLADALTKVAAFGIKRARPALDFFGADALLLGGRTAVHA